MNRRILPAPTEPSFEIVTEPTKKSYVVGDSVDLTGFVGKYVDASGNVTEVGPEDVTAEPETFDIPNHDVEVVLTYEELTDSFLVEVTNPVNE